MSRGKFEAYKKYTLNRYWMRMLDMWSEEQFQKDIVYDERRKRLLIGKVIVKVEKGSYDEFKKIIRACESMGYGPHRALAEINDSPKMHGASTSWKEVKIKNVQEELRIEYITRLGKIYHLTPEKIKHLIAMIHLAFQFQQLTADDVIVKNGKIIKIEHLRFNPKTQEIIIDKDPKRKKAKTKDVPRNKKGKFQPFLERYIKETISRRAIKDECIC